MPCQPHFDNGPAAAIVVGAAVVVASAAVIAVAVADVDGALTTTGGCVDASSFAQAVTPVGRSATAATRVRRIALTRTCMIRTRFGWVHHSRNAHVVASSTWAR